MTSATAPERDRADQGTLVLGGIQVVRTNRDRVGPGALGKQVAIPCLHEVPCADTACLSTWLKPQG